MSSNRCPPKEKGRQMSTLLIGWPKLPKGYAPSQTSDHLFL
jgi:hypothetical protein